MAKKSSGITVTDQFCGAGGSSLGASKTGVEIKLALNHWSLAIDTHNTNFPNALHECTDISACDPRRYPSTNILITSPECTNHSLAKGQKQVKSQLDLFDKGIIDPAAERSRATMWDVPRFAEYHNYEIIIVENVVDARKWIMFPAWLKAMSLLGYEYKSVYINSMHCHPTPQSRDRMYIVFWKKGNKAPDLNFTPKANCSCCGADVYAIQRWKRPDKQWGKYNQQYVYVCPKDGTIVTPYYYAAFNCIDWTDIGKRIGDRKKPLSPNTVARIQHGLDKYHNDPFQVINYTPGYTKSMDDTTAAITTTDHHGLAIPMPFVFKGEHTKNPNGFTRKIIDSVQTQTTRQSMGVVVPYLIEMNRTGKMKGMENAASTITAGGVNHSMALAPLIVTNKGQSKSHPSTKGLTTVTGKPCHGIVTDESFRSFLSAYYGNATLSKMSDPANTMVARDNQALVSYKVPKIEDCYYRMLKPHEVKSAMAFDDSYHIVGNSKEQVKQLGNAVTPPSMEWLVDRCVQSLQP